MKAFLLYADREWENKGRYQDEKAMIQDLGLEALFSASAREIEWEDNLVKKVGEGDAYLEQTMKKVMMVPLSSREEVVYRQDILRDFCEEETFFCELYDFSGQILREWDRLGRRTSGKGNRNTPRGLVTEIYVLQLFVKSLQKLKGKMAEVIERLHGKGWQAFYRRLCEEFSPETESYLETILRDVLFYANLHDEARETGEKNEKLVDKPRIVLGCALGDGLKLGDFRLEEVGTQSRRRRSKDGLLTRAQEYLGQISQNSISIWTGTSLQEQAGQLEYEVVRHIVLACDPFVNAFMGFFDQLHFQLAFYRGAVNLKYFLKRYHIQSVFPVVGSTDALCFEDLKEPVMGMKQHISPVGNTCEIKGKTLLLVTGANQGGKSTFLRSIGIAQVMLQCGLFVTAKSYESGIYQAFFTHFTRREDSAMNSGRLDEELSRMSQIVEGLKGKEEAMVLLNESFATTTEREGSRIAYDVVGALAEAGVKVLMVTHLISFARKIYGEMQEIGLAAEFLSAERSPEGKRSFRMIPHEPELTSFGLELYDQIVSMHTGGQKLEQI